MATISRPANAGGHDNAYFLNMGADALFARDRELYWNADHLSREVGPALASILSLPGLAPPCGQ